MARFHTDLPHNGRFSPGVEQQSLAAERGQRMLAAAFARALPPVAPKAASIPASSASRTIIRRLVTSDTDQQGLAPTARQVGDVRCGGTHVIPALMTQAGIDFSQIPLILSTVTYRLYIFIAAAREAQLRRSGHISINQGGAK